MKKMICMALALLLCLSCAACGGAKTPAPQETAAQETAASVAETVPTTEATVPETEATEPETEATEAPNPYADMPHKNPRVQTGYKTDDVVTVYDCRMYTLDNGYTRFEVDYRTTAGLMPVVMANIGNDQQPAYWYELEAPTTGQEETLVFEIETELLYQTYGPDIHFRDENGEPMSWILVYHTEQVLTTTAGNPVGEEKTLKAKTNNTVKVHKATMQALDNGYVRFTVDATVPADRFISFYDPPNNERFMYISEGMTYGGRETIVVDVPQADVEGLSDVNMNFFNGDKSVGRVYLSGVNK